MQAFHGFSWLFDGLSSAFRALSGALGRIGSGCVFVLGGRSQDDEILDSVEAYDLQRGSWAQAPSLHFPRCELAAAACRGLLFAAKGVTEGEVPLPEIEWLPLEGEQQWLRAPPHPPRRALAAVALRDAREPRVDGLSSLRAS